MTKKEEIYSTEGCYVESSPKIYRRFVSLVYLNLVELSHKRFLLLITIAFFATSTERSLLFLKLFLLSVGFLLCSSWWFDRNLVFFLFFFLFLLRRYRPTCNIQTFKLCLSITKSIMQTKAGASAHTKEFYNTMNINVKQKQSSATTNIFTLRSLKWI
jgi:hypothetical protein